MIKYLLTSQSYLIWIVLHAVLGFSGLFSPFLLVGWFYLTLGSSLWVILRPNTPISVYVSFLAYIVSFELIARMSKTSPYIPYEMGKYLLCFLLVLGIFKYKTSSWPAFLMAMFLFPSLLIDDSGEVSFLDMIFNFLGPLNVALGILFFHGKRISKSMLLNTFRLMILPMVGVLCHAVFKVPDLAEVDFQLGANMVTSGGFGSNQVSTGLGLASFLVFVFWINRWSLTGYRWIDSTLLLVFTFQGLLTFSRGGMMTGFLGIFVIIFFLRTATSSQIVKFGLVRIGKYLLPTLILLVGSFYLVNRLTDGMLLLRYQGETQGTVTGLKQKSLNSITSGRFDIFVGDIELWLDHPILGVGVAASKYMRERMQGIVAHVELSRLLAEHGIFGLGYFIILIYYGRGLLRSHPNPAILGIVCALFVIGLFTSFHAAMRTFISPLMIGLSMLTIKDEKSNFVFSKKQENLVKVNQTVIKL